MKRKMTVFAACLCAAVLVTGCTASNAKANYTVKLGQYKDIEIENISAEVTDEDLDNYINSVLSQNAESIEITDRAVAQGDVVNIDFKGMKDGVAFEGGTAEGTELEIGSGQFIEGFEEGLVGAMPDSQVELNLTFPEDYPSEELAGQDVVFEVKVNSIVEKKLPELNEEFVKSVSEAATVEAYKDEVRAQLQKQAESNVKDQGLQTIMTSIMESSEVNGIPQEMIDEESKSQKDMYVQYSQMYGMEYADFISAMFGMTEEEFNADLQKNSTESVKKTLVLKEIAKKEKIELSEEEMETRAVEYGYANFKEFADTHGEDKVKEVLLMDKVFDYLYDNAKVQ